jgi:hypothetical protein
MKHHDVLTNPIFDIVLGTVFCIGGLIFLKDWGGLATRWSTGRFGLSRRRPPASPRQQKQQEELMRLRHLLTITIGCGLVALGLFYA